MKASPPPTADGWVWAVIQPKPELLMKAIVREHACPMWTAQWQGIDCADASTCRNLVQAGADEHTAGSGLLIQCL